jgi:hypothetical protein
MKGGAAYQDWVLKAVGWSGFMRGNGIYLDMRVKVETLDASLVPYSAFTIVILGGN